MSNIYKEMGHASRSDYLASLAEEHEIDLDTVHTIAGMLGSSEDFDGLVTTLEDFVDSDSHLTGVMF